MNALTNSVDDSYYLDRSPENNIVSFPSSQSAVSNQYTIFQGFLDMVYKRITDEITNKFVMENAENSFDPIYFCDLTPDSLLNSVNLLKSYAARIEDRSHLVTFEDDE